MKKRQRITRWGLLVTLGVALIITTTACPPQPRCSTDADCAEGEICQDGVCVEAECTTDADCDDGLYCNGAETCVDGVCEAGTDPCIEGQECNEETDSCEFIVEDPYVGALDQFESNGPLHDLAAGGHFNEVCAACHHSDPDAAGQACDACHDRDEGLFSDEFDAFVPKLKEAMHTPASDDGKQGCRACHDETDEDGLWDCAHCHTDL